MSDLDRLFYWRGIASQYQNYRGEEVQVPIENRLRLLETMGIDVSSDEAVAAAAYELDVEPWRHFMPPLQTWRVTDRRGAFYVNLHPARLNQEVQWRLLGADGTVLDSGAVIPSLLPEVGDYLFNNLRYSRRLINTEWCEPGYYTVEIVLPELRFQPRKDSDRIVDQQVVTAGVAFAPQTVYQPSWLDEDDDPWGFIIQLYTLRSDRDWGIGDFSDLSQLLVNAAAVGADIIGLNPLHALLPDVDNCHSPYSPSDRRFISPLYIDPVIETDYKNAKKLHTLKQERARQTLLNTLRHSPLVDYAAVKELKYIVFEEMFRHFIEEHHKKSSERGRQFDKFVKECGVALQQFALYEAAYTRWHKATLVANVKEDIIRLSPTSAEFHNALTNSAEAVQFHCYLQWLAHEQLGQCQAVAIANGMKVGLVRDLAVGADGGGAETISNPQQFCTKASVGAPPDPLAEQGQNWGLPPMDPSYLRATGFSHFIQVLRENMSRCGALRIDHAMSLMRLWWCPPGKTADHGAYVYYPFEDMLALLCLESHLNSCAIIGEDLGVVPIEFRQAITEAGVFTNRVFYFEKDNYTSYKAPKDYDKHALAMVNNHDVPTLKSWWDGKDLILRDKLEIFEEGVNYSMMLEQRQRDKQEVFNFLSALDLLPQSWEDCRCDIEADSDLIYAILRAVSRVASRLYVIQLEDVLLMDAPVNVPGTFKEHPNWERKITKTVEDIFNSTHAKALFQQINDERRHTS